MTSPLLAADSWTLWRGTTTFTDVNARLPGEVRNEVQTGLDRPSCEALKQDKLAELRPSSSRGFVDDGFIGLEPGSEGTTKVLMRYRLRAATLERRRHRLPDDEESHGPSRP
jgi:hypothetical protein